MYLNVNMLMIYVSICMTIRTKDKGERMICGAKEATFKNWRGSATHKLCEWFVHHSAQVVIKLESRTGWLLTNFVSINASVLAWQSNYSY